MNHNLPLKNVILGFALTSILTSCGPSKLQSALTPEGIYLSAQDVSGAVGPFFGTWSANSCSEVRGDSRSHYCSVSVTVTQVDPDLAHNLPSSILVTSTVVSDVSDVNQLKGDKENTLLSPDPAQKTGIVLVRSNLLTFIDPVTLKESTIGNIGKNAFTFSNNGITMVFKLLANNQAQIKFVGYGGNGVVRSNVTLKSPQH